MKNYIKLLIVLFISTLSLSSCSKDDKMPEPVQPNPTPVVQNYDFSGKTFAFDYRLYMSVDFANDNCIPLDVQPGESFSTCNGGSGIASGELSQAQTRYTFISDSSYYDSDDPNKIMYYRVSGNTLDLSYIEIGQVNPNFGYVTYTNFGTLVHETSTHFIFDKNNQIFGLKK